MTIVIVCNSSQWQVRFTIYRLSRPTCGVLFVALVLENSTAYNIIWSHYCDVIMRANASQIPSLRIVYSTVYSGADQRRRQSSASMAFVRGFHRGPVNSPHKWPVTRKMFPFDDVIMISQTLLTTLPQYNVACIHDVAMFGMCLIWCRYLYMFWYQIALISMSFDTLIYRVYMLNGILFGGYLIWIWMIWKPFSLISRLLENSRQDLIRSCSNCRADQSILPLPLHQVFNECCRHRSCAEIYHLAC